jgi:predicted nucleotidyltransferase
MEGDWVIVVKKEKKIVNKYDDYLISREEALEIIQEYMKQYKYYFSTLILHGSTAVRMNKPHSDIDIAIVWKKEEYLSQQTYNDFSNLDINQIKNDLMNILRKNVDIANFVSSDNDKQMKKLLRKYPMGNSEQIQCFKDMIKEKNSVIFGNLSELDFSIYINKT